MCTRSQCPRCKLQGISLVCFILLFWKQASNSARRVCEVTLQLTSAASRLIGGNKFLFQWCSKNWWDSNQGTSYLCREQSFAVSQSVKKHFLCFSLPIIHSITFPDLNIMRGKICLGMGKKLLKYGLCFLLSNVITSAFFF